MVVGLSAKLKHLYIYKLRFLSFLNEHCKELAVRKLIL